ncbi:MAG: hypothetical protein JXA74_17060, partial [Anaerolineae bacterium]|nr:hypothetical protein [Anaerolineae bacterium]
RLGLRTSRLTGGMGGDRMGVTIGPEVMLMKTRVPLGLVLVAALQFAAPLVIPPEMLRGIGPAFWILIAAVFALLGINLLRRRAWSRVATIFVQGFNIIVRLLVILSNAAQRSGSNISLNATLLLTFGISVALSALILYYVDLPEIQMVMQ